MRTVNVRNQLGIACPCSSPNRIFTWLLCSSRLGCRCRLMLVSCRRLNVVGRALDGWRVISHDLALCISQLWMVMCIVVLMMTVTHWVLNVVIMIRICFSWRSILQSVRGWWGCCWGGWITSALFSPWYFIILFCYYYRLLIYYEIMLERISWQNIWNLISYGIKFVYRIFLFTSICFL